MLFKYNLFGFDRDGYNKNGFDKMGYDRNGYDADGYDRQGFNRQGINKITGFDRDGYDSNGFNSAGFDCNGFDRDGYSADGIDRAGFNRKGFNANGFNRDGFDHNGFDSSGFDCDGYSADGFDRAGFNRKGFNANGFNRDGFDYNGFDFNGFDRYGFNEQGYDSAGYNRDGFDIDGFDKVGYNKFGFDHWGYNLLGFDSNGFNPQGYNISGYDRHGFDCDGYDANGFGENGFNRDGFNKSGFNKNGFDKYGYDKNGYDADGFNRKGYDCNGYDAFGFDKDNYNARGFDHCGYDRDGRDAEGFDKKGLSKDGYNREGFDNEGYDRCGYNAIGRDRKGYDRDGYDEQGYDKDGFDYVGSTDLGFHREDFDREGFHKMTGFNPFGFNRKGFNINGIDKDGYDEQGYHVETGLNREGYNHDGFDADGFSTDGYNKFGLNRKGQTQAEAEREYSLAIVDHGKHLPAYRGRQVVKWIIRDSDGFDEQGYDRDGYDRDGYNKEGYNRNGYDRDNYDFAGFNKDKINKVTGTCFDPNGFDIEGFDKNGCDVNGYDHNKYDYMGYDQNGYDNSGYNRDGYDRDGYTATGIDKFGFTKKHICSETGTIYNKTGYDYEGFNADGYDENDYHREGYKRSDTEFQKENRREENHFGHVKTITNANRNALINDRNVNESNAPRNRNEMDEDAFDPYEYSRDFYFFSKHQFELNKELALWDGICLQPFFARIDYKKKSKLYIGKHKVADEVVDWADKVCSLYYDYQMYIGNKQYGLSLVRDFDISRGKYNGFKDKYSLGFENKGEDESTNGVISDKRLLAVIEAYKDSKNTHDIIASIQANQYRIITEKKSNHMAVIGCAGSGKTMIMFHRLRYLLYNNRDINVKDTFLVSPTSVLNIESDELSKILQIEKANKLSTVEMYQYIASLYESANDISYSLLNNPIDSNSQIDASEIKALYSESGWSAFAAIIKRLFRDRNESDVTQFINKEAREICERLRAFGCHSDNYIEGLLPPQDQYCKDVKIYELAINELKGISAVNAQEIIKSKSEIIREAASRRAKSYSLIEKTEYFTAKLNVKQVLAGRDKNILLECRAFIKECSELFTDKSTQNSFYKFESKSNSGEKNKQRSKQIDEAMLSLRSLENKKETETEQSIRVSFSNLLNEIGTIKKDLLEFAKTLVNKEDSQIVSMLQILVAEGRFKGSTRYVYKKSQKNGSSTIDHVFIDEKKAVSNLKQLFSIYSCNGVLREEYSQGRKYSSPLDLFADFKSVYDRAKRLQAFYNHYDDSYIKDAICSVCNEIKEKYNINKSKKYEWELFYTCLAYEQIFSAITDHEKYIFIDEFQDFAPSELLCLNRVFPKAVFNYFGDPNQCISAKGIREKTEFPTNVIANELQENYRNAFEITNYVNQTFNMHMLPVGISGKVRFCNSVSFEEQSLKSNDRIAVLYKELGSLEESGIDFKDTNTFAHLEKGTEGIRHDRVNVIPIYAAKGLEFEKVYVIISGMDSNEKYVAMTRALNELIIVSPNN